MKPYLEIYEYRTGIRLAIITDILNEIVIVNKLNDLPNADIEMPIKYISNFTKIVEVLVVIGDCKWLMLLQDVVKIPEKGIIRISLIHILEEHKYAITPPNITATNVLINDLYASPYNFGRNLWTYNFEAGLPSVYYNFSHADKLTILGDVLKLTENVHFRVPNIGTRSLDIGRFGQYNGHVATVGGNDLNILDIEQKIDYSDIANELLITGGSSQNGTGDETLNEIFLNPIYQDANYPVGVIDNGNVEEVYSPIYDIKLSPNRNITYVVRDLQGVTMAGGVYQDTFEAKDIMPLSDEDAEITDNDRLLSKKQLYERAKRELYKRRPKTTYRIRFVNVPCSINVGDKIRLVYNKEMRMLMSHCGSFDLLPVCNIDEKLWITQIERTYKDGVATYTMDLSDTWTQTRDISEYGIKKVEEIANDKEKDDKQRKAVTEDTMTGINKSISIGPGNSGVVTYRLTRDVEYIIKFTFRIILDQFTASVTGVSGPAIAGVTVGNHDGIVTDNTDIDTDNNGSVDVDPHSHTVPSIVHNVTDPGHSHANIAGIVPVPVVLTYFKIYIDGIDFTAYFQAQAIAVGGTYPSGAGIFPGTGLEQEFDLASAGILSGNRSILEPGLHQIRFESDGLVAVTMVEYSQITSRAR